MSVSRPARRGLLLGLYVFAVLFSAALLTAPAYAAGRLSVERGWLPVLAQLGPALYFRRLIMVLAMLLAWPFGRRLGPISARSLGLVREHVPLGRAGLGFATAASTLLLAALAGMAGGLLVLLPQAPDMAWQVLVFSALATGVCVALVEEVLFRGLIQGLLSSTMAPTAALSITAVLFAALHFVAPATGAIKHSRIVWWTGFELVADTLWVMVSAVAHPAWWSPFCTLLFLGLALGLARQRTGGLAFCMGIHAGVVFAAKIVARLLQPAAQAPKWVGQDLRGGWFCAAAMALVFAACWALTAGTQQQPARRSQVHS